MAHHLCAVLVAVVICTGSSVLAYERCDATGNTYCGIVLTQRGYSGLSNTTLYQCGPNGQATPGTNCRYGCHLNPGNDTCNLSDAEGREYPVGSLSTGASSGRYQGTTRSLDRLTGTDQLTDGAGIASASPGSPALPATGVVGGDPSARRPAPSAGTLPSNASLNSVAASLAAPNPSAPAAKNSTANSTIVYPTGVLSCQNGYKNCGYFLYLLGYSGISNGNTLYACQDDGSASYISACPSGCSVAPQGVNDFCTQSG